MSFWNEKGEKLLLVTFDGENYHDRYISLVKSAVLIGKTGPRFRCLHIATISFTLPAAKCQGGALPDTNSAASLKASDFDIRFPD